MSSENENYEESEMLREYKIIRETFDEIKIEIGKKINNPNNPGEKWEYLDDFFNILDFQILFVNQISQTFRGIQENTGYKDKIINNLVKINKDMCQKMILTFIDKNQNNCNKITDKKNLNVIVKKEAEVQILRPSLIKKPKSKGNIRKNPTNQFHSQINLDIPYILSNDDIIKKIKNKVENNSNLGRDGDQLLNKYPKKLLNKSSSALALRRTKKPLNTFNTVNANSSLTIYNNTNTSSNYTTNALPIYKKPKQLENLSLNSRSLTPNSKKHESGRFDSIQINPTPNITVVGKTNNQIYKRNMDRKDQNHLTFEAKLLNKYHQILNNYNSQKTEEECLKETKQKYNETINQSKKKMEQIKYKYDKKLNIYK